MPIISFDGERDLEVQEATFDLLDEVVGTDCVGARLLGDPRRFAFGEDEHALALAEAVREHDRAAQLLVGVTGVEAGADVQLDGLVELGESGLFDEC